MTKLEKMYNLACKNNIEVHFFDLSVVGVHGLNIEKKGLPPMIFLDHSLKNNPKLHLEVLSHELGHHFSNVGDLLKADTYSKQLENNKYENKADKWAYNNLIGEDEIIYAINKNITNLDDLAEFLDVSINILMKKLEYLALQKQTIRLSDTKHLILTNLPSIYIYESFTKEVI